MLLRLQFILSLVIRFVECFRRSGTNPEESKEESLLQNHYWQLASYAAVLTNYYNGLMSSDLNSPFPGTNVPETFQDLIRQDLEILSYRINTKSFKKGGNVVEWARNKIHELYIEVFDNSKESTKCFKVWSTQVNELEYEFIKLRYHTYNMLPSTLDNFSTIPSNEVFP